jgi:2-polyprenyl-3-methyl-5-hydroxy-6-metoxy-1,4-benzoquinol methylase
LRAGLGWPKTPAMLRSPGPNDERRRKEAEFHDQWAADVDVGDLLVDETFTAVTAVENQHILEQFGNVRDLRVLDYGSGMSEGGIYLAKQGARVVSVDVSPGMLENAKRLAALHGVEIETRQVTGDTIPGDADEFDRIYGNGVLHHVPLDTAIPELARVLKPSGVGCFMEPLPYNPLINVYRRIAKEVRTEDETPLSFSQIEQFKQSFADVTHQEFWLTSLAVFLKFYVWDRANPNKERYWKKIFTDADKIAGMFRPLNAIDRRLMSLMPPLGRLCWNTVVTVRRPFKH